ncbi:MAG TPA: Sec-independent protein translocase protein TatB, partial [Aquirhabdus sp.]
MLDVGFSELLLFGIVALIVLGPDKLPVAVRAAGRWYAQLRRMVTNVRNDIEQELQLVEMRDLMQKELARIK